MPAKHDTAVPRVPCMALLAVSFAKERSPNPSIQVFTINLSKDVLVPINTLKSTSCEI